MISRMVDNSSGVKKPRRESVKAKLERVFKYHGSRRQLCPLFAWFTGKLTVLARGSLSSGRTESAMDLSSSTLRWCA